MLKTTRLVLVTLTLLGLLALPSLASAQSADGVRLAVVDVARVMNEVDEMRAVRRRLERDIERRQAEVNRRREAVERFEAELAEGFEMLTDEARQRRLQDLQRQMMELQEYFMNNQQELARAEMEAQQRFLQRVTAIVDEIANRENFTLVIERSAVLFMSSGNDITDRVVTAYNSRHSAR